MHDNYMEIHFNYNTNFKLKSILLLSVFILTGSIHAYSFPQDDKKTVEAKRIGSPPKLDGFLDDTVWKNASPARDFIQYTPYNGGTASQNTEVRILYDDRAIYIGAYLFDPHPDSIYVDLGKRDSDRDINADVFSMDICPYNDGVNAYTFKVSASGVQTDGKAGGGNEMGHNDNSWDAVWESKVTVVEDGWIAEIRIPYSALRFPKTEIQTWGVNFWREIRRTREQSSWNFVNKDIGNNYNHLGTVTGISKITPPLRLSLTPYISSYLETNSDVSGASFSYNGGLDIKYGINESFTLDATLIPDFGQVQSDDRVLNLTPYEVKYNEKRPFFMEGTELFNKGNIFYSRRVGSEPKGYDAAYEKLNPGEAITENPQEASLINATKFSGRTKGGLGIGIFNGMTREMFAIAKDSVTGAERSILTGPFTNYNMIVFDQSLNNNSYVSIENTNVWRRADKNEIYYTANVTATDFKLQNKSRLYSVSGIAAVSQKYYDSLDNEYGHSLELKAGKTGGPLRFEYDMNMISDTYDPNDMGYLRRNNEFNNSLIFSYNRNKPFWRLQSMRNSVTYLYQQLYNPIVFTGNTITISSFSFFMNYWSFSVKGDFSPQGINDYYEPRTAGRYYHVGKQAKANFSFDTNKNKIFYINANASVLKIWSVYDQNGYSLMVGPLLKISRQFTINHQFSTIVLNNDIGYAETLLNGDIIFGKRNNTTITNTFSAAFNFTADSYLSFRLRHYWARADYTDDYYLLMSDGSLTNSAYTGNHDSNYNAFNIDMVYSWRFAPGSELTLVWKNSIYSYGDYIFQNVSDNLNYMFDSPQTNSISLKILYYFDYQYLKKRK
jgi:hypothetical protein